MWSILKKWTLFLDNVPTWAYTIHNRILYIFLCEEIRWDIYQLVRPQRNGGSLREEFTLYV